MNTFAPTIRRLRALCLSKLEERGWVRRSARRPARRREIQMEFPWR